ncbi:MAG: hypothetical protein VB948_16860 [Pseudomonadales bacterium]
MDVNWTTRTFPDNVPWDYGYYVVDDTGAHAGPGSSNLDEAVAVQPDGTIAPPLTIDFVATPSITDGTNPGSQNLDFTYGLGYSYSEDPKLMYCADDLTTQGSDNWWMPSCELSGGSSGGPWIQPLISGSGPIISRNSWGFSDSPGMAGPILVGTSALCVFEAVEASYPMLGVVVDGEAGVEAECGPLGN